MKETNAISLTNVSKEYPGVLALDQISFNVKKGSIHGFLGPNGAGKSTAMKIISGLIPATSGSVLVDGLEVRENLPKVKSMIGLLPEHPPLYGNMRVGDYLDFVFSIHNLDGTQRNLRDQVISKCGLGDVLKRLVGNLSKGYRQRVGIAQALIYNPQIVILDEPTVGLDPVAIAEIRELINKLRDEHTILLSTHILHEVKLICDEITIINKGKILQSGPLSEIEGRFQTRRALCGRVLNWSQGMESKLKERFPIEAITVKTEAGSSTINIATNVDADMRADLSAFFVENGAGLLEIREERVDLEDIFKEVTK